MPCIRRPDSEREAPQKTAVSIRGRRILSNTIPDGRDSPPPPVQRSKRARAMVAMRSRIVFVFQDFSIFKDANY